MENGCKKKITKKIKVIEDGSKQIVILNFYKKYYYLLDFKKNKSFQIILK